MIQNYFELFNLPEKFQLDLEMLQENYRAIQKEIHPDRFATSSENEKVQSMIKSTQANDAYQTLKSPIKRAKYILSLHKSIEKITLPPDFLMQQMEWEEHLEDIEKNIFILGELLNAESQAQELTSLLKSPKVNAKHVKQVIALQYSTNRFVHGHNSLISSIIRRSGFKSYSEFLGYNEGRYISAEALVKSAPDVLILDGDKSFSNKSGSTRYHPALLKGKSKTKALFIETKRWSCGTPLVVSLIHSLSLEYMKLVGQNNAS